MKKVTLLSAIMLSTVLAFGQFDKGRIGVGGNVGFYSLTRSQEVGGDSQDTHTSTQFIFNPAFGYFVMDGLLVGAGISLSSTTEKPKQGSGETTNSIFNIGPLARYYHSSGLFGHGRFAFGSNNTTIKSGSSDIKTERSTTQLELGAGFAHFINEFVMLEAMVLYLSRNNTHDQTYRNSIREVKITDSGICIQIGFNILLN